MRFLFTSLLINPMQTFPALVFVLSLSFSCSLRLRRFKLISHADWFSEKYNIFKRRSRICSRVVIELEVNRYETINLKQTIGKCQ